MRYKLSADSVRVALCDFLKTEMDLLWGRDLDVRVLIHTNPETGRDSFLVKALDMSRQASLSEWYDAIPINSITVDLYRTTPHVQTQIRDFAVTVRNQLRLML